MKKSLLDTGFVFAMLDSDDENHEACVKAFSAESQAILPEPALCEVAYLVLRDLKREVLIDFLNSIVQGNIRVEKTTSNDLARTAELLRKYADTRVDFVDCVIVAIAERLKIQRILTLDRRDFQLFRPLHCSHFEIVP